MEQQQRIFGPYFDGTRLVYADPLTVNRRLTHALGGKPNDVLATSRSQGPEAFEATERLLAAVVAAFDLLPLSRTTGHGCTERDQLTVLAAFLDWCDKKKESIGSSPTSSPPTTSAPAS